MKIVHAIKHKKQNKQLMIYATVAIGIGVAVAGTIAQRLLTPKPKNRGNLDEISVLRSELGVNIPKVYGRARLTGNIHWALQPERKESGGGGKGSSSAVEETIEGSFAATFCEGEIDSIGKLWYNNKLVYNPNSSDPGTVSKSTEYATDHLEIYLGTNNQSPSPFISAQETSRQVNGNINRAYIVVKEDDFTDFGGTPKVEAEIIANSAPITLQFVVEDILANKSTLSPSDYDASLLSTISVDGIVLLQDGSSIRDLIEELQQIYHFVTVEDAGVVRFVPLVDETSVVEILPADIGVREYGQEWAIKVKEENIHTIDLPSSVEIEYNNLENNYLRGHKQVVKQTAFHDNPSNLKTSIVLRDSQATTACTKTLEYAWNQRLQYSNIIVDLDYLDTFILSNAIDIPVRGDTVKILTQTKNVGANLTIEIAGVGYNPFVNDVNVVDPNEGTYTPVETVNNFGDPTAIALDLPLISDTDDDFGIYASAEKDPAANADWAGGTLFVSNNGGAYAPIVSLPSIAAIGTLNTAMGLGNPYMVDKNFKFEVQLTQGILENIPTQEFYNNQVLAYVNGEIFSFQNANLIGVDLYEVDTVLRGLKGTESAIAAHAMGSEFYLVRGNNDFVTIPGDISNLGSTFDIKAVPQGSAESNITNFDTIVVEGNRLVCYSPSVPRITKKNNNDLEITWVRRTRRNGYWLATSPFVPLNEDAEAYDIVIFNGATPVVTTLVTSPTYTYTSAQQIADFGSNQNSLTFTVWQRSAILGRGKPLVVTNLMFSRIEP